MARNNGLRHAHGEFISFLDSDDEWLKEFIAHFVKEFKIKKAECVYCLSGALNNKGKVYSVRNDTLCGKIYKKALEQGYVTSPTFLMVKTSCFDKIGLWDINLITCQDDDICFRLAKYFNFQLIRQPLGIYHTDAENRITNPIRAPRGREYLWDKYKDEVLRECGANILAKHYFNTAQLWANINYTVDCCRVCIKSLNYKISWVTIKLFIRQLVRGLLGCFYTKEKFNDCRKITILKLIKFNYKKREKHDTSDK